MPALNTRVEFANLVNWILRLGYSYLALGFQPRTDLYYTNKLDYEDYPN